MTQCDRGRLLIGPFYSGAERGWQATQHKEWLEEENDITSEHNNNTKHKQIYTPSTKETQKHDPYLTVGGSGVGKPHSTKSGWTQRENTSPLNGLLDSSTDVQNTHKELGQNNAGSDTTKTQKH